MLTEQERDARECEQSRREYDDDDDSGDDSGEWCDASETLSDWRERLDHEENQDDRYRERQLEYSRTVAVVCAVGFAAVVVVAAACAAVNALSGN